MKSKKDDRRVKYTKMVLKQSFISLLEEKDISKISVKEICELADINRTTFYNHYRDQYDLMGKLEDELLENVGNHLKSYTQDETDISLLEILEKIFEYIKQNAKLCKLLLGERGDLNFQKRIMMLAYDKNFSSLANKNLVSKDDIDYIYSFNITGSIGLIQKWLDEDMKKTSSEMAKMLIKLTTQV